MKPQSTTVNPKSAKVQLEEQRSIALYTDNEGAHSLPFVPIDNTVYVKTKDEKEEVKKQKTGFKHVHPSLSQEREKDEKTANHRKFANYKRHAKGIIPKTTTRSYTRKQNKLKKV